MPRIKVCGLTRKRDVRCASRLGADYVGLVFAPSPRQVSVDLAKQLLEQVPGGISTVALFMNQEARFVNTVLEQMDFDLLQFHGSEAAEFCAQFGKPYLKAIAMAGHADPQSAIAEYGDAFGLLFDGHKAGERGGQGHAFDWSKLPSAGVNTWLAGGLNETNVARAIQTVKPWAVDVSSGVESAPGIKDHSLLESFINTARAAAADS